MGLTECHECQEPFWSSLTRNPRAIPHLERLLNDTEPQVRELAADGLVAFKNISSS